MGRRCVGLVLLALLPLGCMEGSKPTPLQRAGAQAKMPVAKALPTEPKAETPAAPPLYDRLGKEAGITQAVEDFVAIVADDENIKEKHRKHFKEGDVAALKKKLIDQVGEATGGPQKYTGKNMKDAHKGLDINNQDFDNLVADLAKALEKNKVAKTDQDELLKMLETMRKDVVEKTD